MSTIEIWLTIAGLTLVTVVTRAFFLLFGERVELPDRAQRALRYAPAAALIAVIVPDLLPVRESGAGLALFNPKLAAALAACALFWYQRKMVWMIVVGMAVFTLLRLYG